MSSPLWRERGGETPRDSTRARRWPQGCTERGKEREKVLSKQTPLLTAPPNPNPAVDEQKGSQLDDTNNSSTWIWMKVSIIIPFYRMSDPQAGKQRLLFYFLILWYWKFGEFFQKLAKLASPIFITKMIYIEFSQIVFRKKHLFFFAFPATKKNGKILKT